MSWWNKLVRDAGIKKKIDEPVKEPTSEEVRRAALDAEKAAATKAGEPWVAVLDTQVNKDNIRNGFFELDWNNEFIEELLDAGYQGESNEQIVDQWFRTIVSQMLQEEGQDPKAEAGYINVVPIDKGKSEVS
jgi:predicted Ser/Thr protein kinase|tara:strand:+ start:1633 stop:2028 length:396 start_codon:yes stop_codon:yes gene_type:complete